MKFFSLAVTVLCLLFTLPVHPSFAAAEVERYRLDNGLTVLINEMPSSEVVSVYVLIKVGSATEGDYLGSGIAHFIEHMFFKGTDKRPVGSIGQEVKSLGGRINASTSFDYTIYTLDLPVEHAERGLDIIADMMLNIKMDPAEVDKEREVIFGEMRLYRDRPDRKLSELAFDHIYVRHPYQHPIIGYESLFAKITRDDLKEFYDTFYVPGNTVLSIAGNIEADVLKPIIEEKFKHFEPATYVTRDVPQEPEQVAFRDVTEPYATDLLRVSLGYQGVALNDSDMYALDVLAMALGQGASSRLYKDVYKKRGLVESIRASNFTPVDRGVFEVEAVMSRDTLADTVAAVKENIEAIKKKGITWEELDRAKRRVVSQSVFQHQTSSAVAYSTAFDEAFLGDARFSYKYPDEVKNVTNDDIMRVARQYLVDQKLTQVVLWPEVWERKGSDEADKAEALPIERIVLDNGLTVLLKEDHTLPLVTLQAMMQGGGRHDPEGKGGLSELAGGLWLKGTKKRTAQHIADEISSRGGSANGFSGRNSLGLSFDFLDEDLEYGLNLMADVILNPEFPENEIRLVKQSLETKRRRRSDDISEVTSRKLQEMLFPTHPFGRDPLGTPASLMAITRGDIAAFYDRLRQPGNLVVTVFGNFERDEVLEDIERLFGSMKPGEPALPLYDERAPSRQVETLHMDKEQAMVMIGFRGPNIYHDDRYPTEVMTSILGSSLSGRLFTRIRDELGQAYTLSASYVPGLDAGMIYLYVLTTDENVDAVQEVIFKELKDLTVNPVTAEELADSQAYINGRFQMGHETLSALGFAATLDELYGLGYDHVERYPQLISAVTPDDIMRAARSYFIPEQSVVVVTRPQSASQKK